MTTDSDSMEDFCNTEWILDEVHRTYLEEVEYRDIWEQLATCPRPDIRVSPSGKVIFEWYVAPRRVFSVAVGDELHYAGLFGDDKVHGATHDIGVVLENVRRVFQSSI